MIVGAHSSAAGLESDGAAAAACWEADQRRNAAAAGHCDGPCRPGTYVDLVNVSKEQQVSFWGSL